MSEYDVIVIGCGTAGSRAAATAQAEGAKVLVAESARELGGLCILRGCMPTKTLLETAHRVHEIRDAKRFGIEVAEPRVEFGVQMDRMRRLVARFQRAKVGAIERAGYELRRHFARFTGPHTVEIEGEELRAKAFVIGTGSRVRDFPLTVPSDVRLLDSDDMFLLEEPPESILVRGGGAVGLEFAQWLARMGSRVVLSTRSPLLHRVDREMGEELGRALAEEMTVHAASTLRSVESLGGGRAKVTFTTAAGPEEHVEVAAILNATGRVPAVEGLDLEAVGLNPHHLQIDPATFQSGVPHVFVAGDTTGDKQILHEANLEGAIAGRNALRVARGESQLDRYDAATPPVSVIFSDPPFATVGRSQQELEKAGVAFAGATKHFPQQGRGIVVGAEHGFLRLLAEPGGGKVLGCQILGPRADDLIHIPAAVMHFAGTARDMFRMPWYHPTLAEAFIEVSRELSR